MAIVESRVKNGSLVIGGRVFSCVPTAVSVVPGSARAAGEAMPWRSSVVMF